MVWTEVGIFRSKKSNMKYQNEEIRIAGKKTIIEWENLKRRLDVNHDSNWDEAFSYFEYRLKTRYIRPIKIIQYTSTGKGEGFAIVNLQCSLIETIESFYNGWIYNHTKEESFQKGYYHRELRGTPINGITSNGQIFNNFFSLREPFKGKFDGWDFYNNVRCGLLHETQTKNGWLIRKKHSNENIFFENIGEEKIIYRNNFQKAIEDVIEKYKRAIVNRIDYGEVPVPELRENFKAKFDHICTISKNKK